MLSVLQTLDGGALLWIQENLRGLLDPIRRGIYYTGQHRPDVDRALSSHAVLEAYPESGGGGPGGHGAGAAVYQRGPQACGGPPPPPGWMWRGWCR